VPAKKDNPDPRLQALIVASRRFAKTLVPRTGVFCNMKLRPPEVHLLFLLHFAEKKHPGGEGLGIQPSVLAERMGVTAGNITQIITPLEGSGLVVRQGDAGDRRKVAVSLTPKGREALDAASRAYEEAYDGLMRDIGAEECEQFTRLLNKAADFFQGRMDPSSSCY
jgi:DNA-binding MarR family transcriptional regulator